MATSYQNIPKWLGPAVVTGALLLMIFGKPAAGVSPWVAYAACLVFVFAGVAITAQSFGYTSIAKMIGPLIFVTLGSIVTWIGFAPGERTCRTGIAFFGASSSGMANCKIIFSIAAVLFWGFFIVVMRSNFRHKQRKSMSGNQDKN